MKIIDLNFNLKGLDKNELSPVRHAGQLLADVMAADVVSDSLKFYSWALKLYAFEQIEIDVSDTELLKKFVKDTKNLTVLSKAQILEKMI